MEAIIRPTVLYGSEIWGSSLLQTDWARLEGVQTLLLRRIIRCKRTVPQPIIQAEFGVHPFRLEVIFRLVSFLRRVRSFRDSTIGRERYPYLALCSSEALASDPPSGRARGWFSEASRLLQSMTISPERLPPFSFSLDAPRHLLPTRQVLNQAIREDIYRLYIQVTWTSPSTSLGSKMSFYLEHFLELRMASSSAPLIHAALDALTQDPFGSAPGWISSTPD
jgi:hypothetical protein